MSSAFRSLIFRGLAVLASWGPVHATEVLAADDSVAGTIRKVVAYRLESVEVIGSTRLSAAQLQEEFGLAVGTPLDDTLVMDTRSRLLGLGLFKSAILVMRKGSKPGFARLVVELEDDDLVLTDWAIGGEFGMTLGEQQAKSIDPNGSPRGYRLSLVGRNLFGAMHRGAATADVDSRGILREGHIAYGLPRFTLEDVQFDADFSAVDVSRRYLNALGFGARGQGLWSRSIEGFGDLQYGMATYVNRKPRFAMPGFPRSIAGPKLSFHKETRLRTFVPSSGHLVEASLLFAPIRSEHSTLEFHTAQTFDLYSVSLLTFDLSALSVGVVGSAVRGETRLDIPLSRAQDATEDQAAIFLRLRGGFDRTEASNLVGSAGILGIRYHSSGFIAEIALQVTRSPEELIKTQVPTSAAEAQ